MDADQTALCSYLDQHEDEMFKMLEQIVNMDSFSHDGQAVNKVGDLAREWMANNGFEAERLPHPEIPEDEPWMSEMGNVVTARTHSAEAGPGIILLGHMDTVYPTGYAALNPFKVEGEKIYGAGVADMKAGVVANMFAAKALKELGLIDAPLTVVFSPDEELGSPTASRVYKKILRGGLACLSSEPGFLNGGITIKRKGSGHFFLEIDGISSHAGREYEKGASANLELAHKMLAYDKFVDLKKGNTVNTGIITGGTSANCVSPKAAARLHITFQTYEDGEALANNIREMTKQTFIPGTKSRISGGVRLYPLTPDAEQERLLNIVLNSGESIGHPLKPCETKGASEAGFTSTILGIPSICSLGAEGANIHADGEYILKDTLLPRTKIIALSAIRAAKEFKPVERI